LLERSRLKAVGLWFLREFEPLHSQFLIGCLTHSQELGQALQTKLDQQIYRVHISDEQAAFLQWISQNRHRVDCLILELSSTLPETLETLQSRDILLPMLIIQMATPEGSPSQSPAPDSPEVDCRRFAHQYHRETHCITRQGLAKIEYHVHQAITQFLNLPHMQVPEGDEIPALEDTRHFLLSLQQQRLADKLHERLGYLGVYYKRNPDNFLRNLPAQERAKVLEQMRLDYRNIVLSYFGENSQLNQKIDDFVNTAFFIDISVSKVVEIHMELMDSFSKQLKLEGRSEEILLDYRLTLIDVIAHLCEMYRRSIPREG
jgi:circadian clock protein KaiA